MEVELVKFSLGLEEDEDIEWHVGGHSGLDTRKALEEIGEALATL